MSVLHAHCGVVFIQVLYENYTQQTVPQFGSDSITGLNKEC